jgi:hypothetical protein
MRCFNLGVPNVTKKIDDGPINMTPSTPPPHKNKNKVASTPMN